MKVELPPYKERGVGNDVYGTARLQLATLVKSALESAGAVWFLDGGTLLGAYRNGQLIAHDDDFDTAIYLPTYRGERDLEDLREKLAPALPAPYEMRVVTSYAHKLEIYDANSTCYLLPKAYYKGADFYTVTVDIQVMTDTDDGSVVYIHDMLKDVRVPRDAIRPTGEIQCEGLTFNSPKDIPRFLEAQYGYIGADARFDPVTKKYVKIKS